MKMPTRKFLLSVIIASLSITAVIDSDAMMTLSRNFRVGIFMGITFLV